VATRPDDLPEALTEALAEALSPPPLLRLILSPILSPPAPPRWLVGEAPELADPRAAEVLGDITDHALGAE
jgi:hypothetical protein